LAPRCRLITS